MFSRHCLEDVVLKRSSRGFGDQKICTGMKSISVSYKSKSVSEKFISDKYISEKPKVNRRQI